MGFTKKQHYYPKLLLKNFSDEFGKLTVYDRKQNKERKIGFGGVCYSINTYESEGLNNYLEKEFSKIESKLGIVLSRLLRKIQNFATSTDENFTLSEVDQDFLFKYMIIQAIRTDVGRLLFVEMVNSLTNFRKTRRVLPVELNEINENKNLIKLFNEYFNNEGNLLSFVEQIQKPESMNFHICVCDEPILTSDNPVIGTDEGKRLLLPINSYICIEFVDSSLDASNESIFLKLDRDHVRYINEAEINTANYFVISQYGFNMEQRTYIYNRFNRADWKFGKRHFPEL